VREERFGPYRVLSELDAGVATTVLRGAHESLPRPVVIKRLRDVVALDSAFARGLEREAKILSELAHPHIVALYDFVKTGQQMGLVLEHVEGVRLDAARAAAGGKLQEAEIAAIGAALSDALAHAHARGIVHRDVKPGNVLLGKHGELKLLDFGAAAYVGETEAPSRTHDGELAFGTPAYLAPEQLFGAEADPKSDVFSLGVVLYELACGEKPFEGRAARAEIVSLAKRAPELSRTFTDLVDGALARLPTERPAAEELASALRAIAGPINPSRAAKAVLARGHLMDAALTTPMPHVPPAPRRLSVPPWALIAAAVVVIALLGVAFTRTPQKDTKTLAPSVELGELSVLANPWAEVWIDGKLVETTPFARPIVLSAGLHHVVLRHPDAADEPRDVRIARAAPVVLDVTMAIREITSGDAGLGEVQARARGRADGGQE
jgi:serine/threonine-protein kinase